MIVRKGSSRHSESTAEQWTAVQGLTRVVSVVSSLGPVPQDLDMLQLAYLRSNASLQVLLRVKNRVSIGIFDLLHSRSCLPSLRFTRHFFMHDACQAL